jgi:PAS domain S-box-containing protein
MNKILLIDDEADILRVLSMTLKADGYQVVTADNGEDGLALFNRESPDIVLTDIKMPGMDGIEVLKQIKEISDEVEVIIVTGHGDIDSAIEAMQFGASDFINKPIRDKALAVSLKRAHEKIDIKRQLKAYTHELEDQIALATRELRRRSNFQIKLIRSSNDGIVATDRELNIVIYNPEAEKIFGYPPSAMINKKRTTAIYSREIADAFEAAMQGGNHKKDIFWRESIIISQTGETIPVRFSGTVLYEKEKMVGTVAFFQDLREIKRLEHELVNSERLAAIGQTVAGLSHGIKNILHGLKGGSYLVDIGIKKGDTDRLKNGWQMVKKNIDRTADLVLDLLSYSKEREPEYENCSPNEIAEEIIELLEDNARENSVRFLKELDPSIGTVSMDAHTIHSALLNLASNAIDACLFDENTDKDWYVSVKTTRESDRLIRFDVSDNGSGMSEELKEKLFTSFFSTKGHRGTGLGLMVTRKLIEEHGGSIEVDSQLGFGTTFTMHLPYDT